MVVFDTDIVTIIQRRDGAAFRAVDQHMARSTNESFYTTIVTFEEQMRGWLAAIASAKDAPREVAAYARLHALIEYFRDRPLLPFSETASTLFRQLKSRKLRVGSMDLKIAAIVIANDAVLVTRNVADFKAIPRLRVEDWTKPL